jgi:hypothetical protein
MTETKRTLDVYNLEFQWPDEKMRIGPYVFVPAEDYQERYLELQHLVAVHGGHHGSIKPCTGSHQITGTVVCPEEQRVAALGWGHKAPTELDDILLLLSMFTLRKVFVLDAEDRGEALIADPRLFHYGGGLRLSLPKATRPDPLEGDEYSVDLANGLSDVNETIRSEDWQSTYGKGHFLFLFGSACHRQIIETSFLLSWTIWEHLFRLHNEHWISQRSIRSVNAREKIRYVLTRYGLVDQITQDDTNNVDRLTLVRHRLSHDGSFAQADDARAADLFIRLTELVVAKTLGLEPSEVFSPKERWDRFSRDELL